MSSRLELWPAERLALKPPENLTVSEWAERYRVLDEGAAEPGPMRLDRAPYQREILDAWIDPEVEEITIEKAVQMGMSEVALTWLAYTIDQDPGPFLWVMDRQQDYEYIAEQRISPMLQAAPKLDQHRTGWKRDEKKHSFSFHRMTLYLGAARSPSDLASRPIRYLVQDDVDRWPRWSGREGDPVELSRDRTTTFWNRKIGKNSTPTTVDGYIHQEFLRGDQRRFNVPCPLCGEFQVLSFDRVKVRPDDERDPETIRTGRLAVYVCVECREDIPDDPGTKAAMLLRGVWVPAGATISSSGELVDVVPSRHRSYHLSALYSPWRSWSEILARFFEVKDEKSKLMTFVNQTLGEVWEEKGVETTTAKVLSLVDSELVKGTVPDAALALVAGVDVQQDHFYYVVRAFGQDVESWLVDEGRVETWETLINLLFRGAYHGRAIDLIGIDARYRTWEVYEVVAAWPDCARAFLGEIPSRPTGMPFRTSRVEKNPHTGAALAGGLVRFFVNVNMFKDRIARLMNTKPDEPGGFHIHADPPDDYVEHMTAERKVLRHDERTGLAYWTWQPRWKGKPNHFWDCEVYAQAAAHLLGVFALRSDLAPEQPAKPPRRKRRKGGGWIQSFQR